MKTAKCMNNTMHDIYELHSVFTGMQFVEKIGAIFNHIPKQAGNLFHNINEPLIGNMCRQINAETGPFKVEI